MMPADLIGLVLFLTAVSPGYVYLRIAEARKPRPKRATLLLTIEIFLIGSSFTLASLLIVTSVFQLQGGFVDDWVGAGRAYVTSNYAAVSGWLILIMAVAYSAAAATARLIYRHKAPGYSVGGSIWAQVLARDHDQTRVVVSIHLKDGRVLSGYVSDFDLDSDDSQRDIALQRPIYERRPDGPTVRQHNIDRLIVSSELMMEVGVAYEDVVLPVAARSSS